MRLSKVAKCLVVSSCMLLVVGCPDPQTAILKIFSRQGLTLLEPTRDYIEVGGIVLLPKGTNSLEYEDPFETLTPATGTSTNFTSVIHSQTDTSTSAAQLQLALTKLVSLPIGFSFQNGPQTVQLAQVNTSGTRYTSQMVSTLLKKPDTASEINSRLQEGDRVFIIQEVYTSKALTVSASGGLSLNANLGGTPITKTCGTTQQSGSQQSGSQQSGSQKSGSQQSGSQQGGSQQSGSQKSGSQQGSSQQGSSQQSSSQQSGSQGVSIGVCHSTNSSLSFTSDTAIPFAVRLNEVQIGPGGVLQVKFTNFHLPNMALGNASDVAATILVNPEDPTAQLTKIPHRPR